MPNLHCHRTCAETSPLRRIAASWVAGMASFAARIKLASFATMALNLDGRGARGDILPTAGRPSNWPCLLWGSRQAPSPRPRVAALMPPCGCPLRRGKKAQVAPLFVSSVSLTHSANCSASVMAMARSVVRLRALASDASRSRLIAASWADGSDSFATRSKAAWLSSMPAVMASCFASGEIEAIFTARWASFRSMPSSRVAALMPPDGRPSPSRPRTESFGPTWAETSLESVSLTHSAICSARSCTVSSARCRFSAISQRRASVSLPSNIAHSTRIPRSRQSSPAALADRRQNLTGYPFLEPPSFRLPAGQHQGVEAGVVDDVTDCVQIPAIGNSDSGFLVLIKPAHGIRYIPNVEHPGNIRRHKPWQAVPFDHQSGFLAGQIFLSFFSLLLDAKHQVFSLFSLFSAGRLSPLAGDGGAGKRKSPGAKRRQFCGWACI